MRGCVSVVSEPVFVDVQLSSVTSAVLVGVLLKRSHKGKKSSRLCYRLELLQVQFL